MEAPRDGGWPGHSVFVWGERTKHSPPPREHSFLCSFLDLP